MLTKYAFWSNVRYHQGFPNLVFENDKIMICIKTINLSYE